MNRPRRPRHGPDLNSPEDGTAADGGMGGPHQAGDRMSGHVCWMLELEMNEGRESDVRSLMKEMVDATKANEPGTLDYEWSFSADGRRCHLWERYADSQAALTHMGTFGETYAARFLDVMKPVRLVLYGSPSAAVKEGHAAFNPVFMQAAEGFSR